MKNRIQVTENYYLDELVNPTLYAERGARAQQVLDVQAVKGLQRLRELADSAIVVNNWISGGKFKESGAREFNTRTGAKRSMHKYGRAFDLKWIGNTPEQLFELLKKHEAEFIQNGWITVVEHLDYTPTWLHIDNRWTGSDEIVVVKP